MPEKEILANQKLKELINESFYTSFDSDLVKNDKKIPNMLDRAVSISNFADYQCILGWSFFSWLKKNKLLGKDDYPSTKTEIVEKIKSNIPENDIIGEIVISENDYMNINLSDKWISDKLMRYANNNKVEPPPFENRKIIIDYSSPNIAKTMHVGHLRSTIIGNSIYKLFKFVGCDITGLNHFGDCGTQFGMLLEYIERNHSDFMEKPMDIHGLEKAYKASKKCFDADEDFMQKAKEKVVKLQSGDEWAHNIWKKLVEISKVSYQEIYDILEITDLIDRGESYYIKYLAPLIKELEERGIVEEDNGAKVIKVPRHSGVFMVQKSDGGYGYDSTDLAAIKQRLLEMNADQIIYLTDIGQQLHFNKLFDAARMIGWCDNKDVKLNHVGFGLILSKEGGKFRTRSGEVIHLIDLLMEAKTRCTKILEERVATGQSDLTPDEIDDIAGKIGYGSVKYADLRLTISKNYTFDYDKMLDFNGDTAVYSLYAYVRMKSIIRNSGIDLSQISDQIVLTDPKEREFAALLVRYQEVILSTIESLSPYMLCEYLYKVCSKFSEFYSACKVNGHEHMNSRLKLIYSASLIVEKLLYLLGINTIDKL